MGTLNYNYPFELFYIEGGQIWSSTDGTTWSPVVGQGPYGSNTAPGFGDSLNLGITSLRASNGTLYAGTARMQLGIGIIDGSHLSLTLSGRGCELWRKGTTSWTKCQGGGFGDERNAAILSMEPFGGKLFVGTTNGDLGVVVNTDTGEVSDVTYTSNGLGVYSYDGSQVTSERVGGFGDTDDFSVTSMCATTAFGGNKLLVGAANADGPGKLQVYDGSAWRPAADDGFGSADNNAVSAVSVSGDSAYAGTVNTEAGCEVWYGTPPLPPEVDSVAPGSGPVGTPVTISGRNFGASRGSSTVEFNNVEAVDVTAWSNTEITAAVPPGATTGPVTVTTAEGSSNGMAFTVTFPPEIDAMSPSSGPAGTEVKLTGSHFGPSRSSSYVEFGSVKASAYTLWTDTQVKVDVPPGAQSGTVKVITSAGVSNGVDFTVTRPPYISGISPSSGPAGSSVTISGGRFSPSRGSSFVKFAGSKASAYTEWTDTRIKAELPPGTTSGNVTVTTAAGTSNGVRFTVKSAVPDEPEPVTYPDWYLAEGTCAWGFDTYISIANPNESAVHAQVTYMSSDGPVSGGTITLPAMSQTTVNPEETLGEKDFSTRVVCTEKKTIAVDRTMSWSPAPGKGDKHCSIGVTSPAKTWYLPEGSSSWGFETWLLVQNPNESEASVTVTYMTEGDGPLAFTKKVPANSRASFNMADDIGAKDASIKVESAVPVIPERAMYRDGRNEGHDSIGTTSPAHDYYLAEGTTAWGFTTYVLVQNPNPGEASVTVTYMTPEGPVSQPAFSMPANSRKTIRVNDALAGRDLSTSVHADKPIIAERAMYWDSWQGEKCHDSIGMSAPHTSFYLPDGNATMEFVETWTLVQNPNRKDVDIKVTYLTPSGTGNKSFTDTVPANSRKTYSMADVLGGSRAAVLVTSTSGGRIMCERAMYWGDGRTSGTVTIGGFSD